MTREFVKTKSVIAKVHDFEKIFCARHDKNRKLETCSFYLNQLSNNMCRSLFKFLVERKNHQHN